MTDQPNYLWTAVNDGDPFYGEPTPEAAVIEALRWNSLRLKPGRNTIRCHSFRFDGKRDRYVRVASCVVVVTIAREP